jgi:hypothetical protein
MTASTARPKYRKRLLLLLLLVALLAQILYLPLPQFLLRPVALQSAAWLVNEADAPPSAAEAVAHKFVGEMVQQSLLSHFHAAGPDYQGRDDARFAGEQLLRLRRTLLSQKELYHEAMQGPVALTGLGWCDMQNALGGRLLAHDFDQVSIIGVRDDASGGGHSFGRFWSPQYNSWLYFDVWAEVVSVFRQRGDGVADYLYEAPVWKGPIRWPGDIALLRPYHAKAAHGFVHNHLQASTGGYFGHRLLNLLRYGTTAPGEAIGPLNALAALALEPSTRVAPPKSSAAAKLYVAARIDHLLGQKHDALASYRQAARLDGGASVFGLAATDFAKALSEPRP